MPKPRKPVSTHRTTLMLPLALWKELKYYALETDRTIGAVVSEALRAYLKKVGEL